MDRADGFNVIRKREIFAFVERPAVRFVDRGSELFEIAGKTSGFDERFRTVREKENVGVRVSTSAWAELNDRTFAP